MFEITGLFVKTYWWKWRKKLKLFENSSNIRFLFLKKFSKTYVLRDCSQTVKDNWLRPANGPVQNSVCFWNFYSYKRAKIDKKVHAFRTSFWVSNGNRKLLSQKWKKNWLALHKWRKVKDLGNKIENIKLTKNFWILERARFCRRFCKKTVRKISSLQQIKNISQMCVFPLPLLGNNIKWGARRQG